MRQLFSLRLIITFAFLNCASYTSFAAVNPVTVTYQGGTSSFSVGDTLGTANYVVAVSPNVRPNNVPLNFSLKTSNSSSGLSAVQQLSYPSPCSGVSTVCGNTFSLKAGESCCLAFSLSANQVGTYTMQPTISTTPPAFSAQAPEPLTITTTPALKVSPSSLSLTQGGFSSCVTVTNLSSNGTIINLNQTLSQGTTQATLDTFGTTCASSLPASGQCNYCFLPGIQEGTALSTIAANNIASPVNVPITVSAANPTTITVPATAIIPVYSASGTPLSLTVRNTGLYNAFNVHADLSNTGWSGVTQDATNCTDIPANGGTCTLYFRSTTPYLAKGGLTVTGDNLTAPAPIAFAFSINTYLIFALNSPASTLPKVIGTFVGLGVNAGYPAIAATSLTNGFANTAILTSALPPGTLPANRCYDTPEGTAPVGTWYLPAICQMGGIGQGAGCVNDDSTTIDNLLQLGFLPSQYNNAIF